jgi:hypothetical protein
MASRLSRALHWPCLPIGSRALCVTPSPGHRFTSFIAALFHHSPKFFLFTQLRRPRFGKQWPLDRTPVLPSDRRRPPSQLLSPNNRFPPACLAGSPSIRDESILCQYAMRSTLRMGYLFKLHGGVGVTVHVLTSGRCAGGSARLPHDTSRSLQALR